MGLVRGKRVSPAPAASGVTAAQALPEQDNPAAQTARLVRLCTILALATAVCAAAAVVSMYVGLGKRVVVIGATESGRFIESVSLARPYLNDQRVQAFAEECLRRSFAHDFLNFRTTMGEAGGCYTPRAGQLYVQAMQPLLKDLVERRMVMTTVIDRPPVVVSAREVGGVHTWTLQAQVTLHRDGTRERVPPASYRVHLVVARVPLEESVRGVLVSMISLSPA